MKKNLAIFYHHLKNRGHGIPYVLTLAFFVFSLGLHWFQAVLVFDIPQHVYSPIQLESPRLTRWTNSLIFFTPIFTATIVIFKKSSLEKYQFTEMDLQNGHKKHIVYMVFSIILFMGLLVKDGLEKGDL